MDQYTAASDLAETMRANCLLRALPGCTGWSHGPTSKPCARWA